jgi:hypothetical protein
VKRKHKASKPSIVRLDPTSTGVVTLICQDTGWSATRVVSHIITAFSAGGTEPLRRVLSNEAKARAVMIMAGKRAAIIRRTEVL